jgi:alanyl-tRNA synthetase
MATAAQIRQQFLDFFREKQHRIVPSAPVVPIGDPTLLFTNAGMNQFKDVFLGTGSRDYTRAADTQKCIRVSGKHNDLEEVGVDTYHHTFFEMLGNWSFGDYFKEEAIAWAWELLAVRLGLDGSKMYATVFGGDPAHGIPADEEAEALWPQRSGIPAERVLRFGHKDNFWEMGEVGPCGPCTEIHFDRGPAACDRKGVPGHVCQVNGDCARYIEIWNLVFIQFARLEDGSLKPLPAKHVDTGMGLERLVALLQGVVSNYDTDLFMPIIRAIAERTGHPYGADERKDIAMRVIADHVRALSAAIADGALPGKQGRSYVIRRLLRRAARFGRQVLGTEGAFLCELVPVVAGIFDGVFPEIGLRLPHIQHVIEDEERAFARTIDSGIAAFDKLAGALRAKGETVVPGADAYRLYHQDGFPRDLIELMAREQGYELDEAGWAAAEAAHKEASKGEVAAHRLDLGALEGLPKTEFLGYWERGQAAGVGTEAGGLKVLKLLGTEALVLDRTPFYAESGGQVGDAGVIVGEGEGDGGFRFRVEDTGRVGDVVVHFGELELGDTTHLPATVTARVDAARRRDIMANHTATHLLHWALERVLGDHANQQGSLVAPEYLRFDFTHPRSLSPQEVLEIERLVNARVAENSRVAMTEESLEAAKARGVTALFGEKYGEVVRVVQVGDFSQELCGGTHCQATGDLGYFRITAETAVQAGVRRIFAKTRSAAVEEALADRGLLQDAARRLTAPTHDLVRRIEALQEQVKELKKKGAASAQQDVGTLRRRLLEEAELVGGARVVVARIDVPDRKALGELADALRSGDDQVAGALAAVVEEKTVFLAFATKDLVTKRKLSAGEVVKQVAEAVGQKGGGRPDFAQTGWKGEEGIETALAAAKDAFRAALA